MHLKLRIEKLVQLTLSIDTTRQLGLLTSQHLDAVGCVNVKSLNPLYFATQQLGTSCWKYGRRVGYYQCARSSHN